MWTVVVKITQNHSSCVCASKAQAAGTSASLRGAHQVRKLTVGFERRVEDLVVASLLGALNGELQVFQPLVLLFCTTATTITPQVLSVGQGQRKK